MNAAVLAGAGEVALDAGIAGCSYAVRIVEYQRVDDDAPETWRVTGNPSLT